jgi:hypothetical protein
MNNKNWDKVDHIKSCLDECKTIAPLEDEQSILKDGCLKDKITDCNLVWIAKKGKKTYYLCTPKHSLPDQLQGHFETATEANETLWANRDVVKAYFEKQQRHEVIKYKLSPLWITMGIGGVGLCIWAVIDLLGRILQIGGRLFETPIDLLIPAAIGAIGLLMFIPLRKLISREL